MTEEQGESLLSQNARSHCVESAVKRERPDAHGSVENETPLERDTRLRKGLFRIQERLTTSLDQDELCRTLLVQVVETLGCRGGLLEMRHEDHWLISDVYGLKEELRGRRLTEEQSSIVRALAEESDVLVFLDAETHPVLHREIRRRYGARSALVIPLLLREQLLGGLVLLDNGVRPFLGPGVREFAAKTAASAALALSHAQLFAEREALRQEQDEETRRNQALSEMLAFSSSALDETHILRTVLSAALDALRGSVGVLWEHRGGRWEVRYTAGQASKAGVLHTEELDQDLIDKVLTERTPIALSGVFRHASADAWGATAAILIPLMVGRDVPWLLQIGYQHEPSLGRDLRFARELSFTASLALQNARIFSTQRSLARTLQQALLSPPRRVRGVSIGHAYASATSGVEVGGDFYDLFSLPGECLGVVLGDVSGKGVEAAILASLVKNSLLAYLNEDQQVGRAVANTNGLFIRESPARTFVTLFCGVLELQSGLFRYVQAGHPPGLVRRRADGDVFFLQGGSPVVGAFAHATYQERDISLAIGDLLVLYTDGIMEARSAGRFFGEQGIASFVRTSPTMATREMPRALLQQVLHFAGGHLADDVAVLCIRRKRK